jgi:SAM-dependent methyltransferase
MTVESVAWERAARECDSAAELAGVAALLEIGDQLGVSYLLDRDAPCTAEELARAADIPLAGAATYARALLTAGLLIPAAQPDQFRPSPDLADRRYEAGYLSWALSANRPFIDHAPQFLRDQAAAAGAYQRDGRQVAVASGWVGSRGFYPAAVAAIRDHGPGRIADLGAGAGGLLIQLLQSGTARTAVALDISEAACAEARRAARQAGLAERLQVAHRSIQSLADDPGPVEGTDVVHAGFVLHDIAGQPDVLDAVLASCRRAMAPGGRLVITDAVPNAPDPSERSFSALFTYLHDAFMGVCLPTEEEWLTAFRSAGFDHVTCTRHLFPAGRLFVASA